MDNTIIGAIIGASSAILINGLIYCISRHNELKREKVQVISEIISILYSQVRYAKRFVGYRTWLNYYHRSLPLFSKPEYHSLVNNKIDFQIKMIEDIEFRLVESDSRLATLSAKYTSLFRKDKEFKKSFKEINEFIFSDNAVIENFTNWSDESLRVENIESLVQKEELNSIKSIEDSFSPIVNKLLSKLESKL
jgi:hypothetical protein